VIRGILLDVEGTTTPVSFVYDVLFPYARRYAERYSGGVTDLRREYDDDVRAGESPPQWSDSPVPYIHWLMDQDRKSTALKRIQGEIWLEGFQNGQLHGEVFDDVPGCLARWEKQGIDIRIFSSGSTLAQRLLFSTTVFGDLTQHLRGYFDTTTGPKNQPASYRAIADAFALPAFEILFVSDVVGELDAASAAGMQTRLCIRPGNHPQPSHTHSVITGLDDLDYG
jgi:enolase-phosphatase E1